jgi:hypothetical protein
MEEDGSEPRADTTVHRVGNRSRLCGALETIIIPINE